jgi:ribosomal-protein-serine acetyltransferase
MTGPPFDLGDGGLLRPFRMNDLDPMWEAIQQERERLGTWMPWIRATTVKDDERAWLEAVTRDPTSMEGCGIWVDGELAGGIGMSADPYGIVAEIGYWIRTPFEGRGFVTRGCATLLDHAFQTVGVHRVVIRAGVENRRSRAVPERLGFTFEGVHREEGRGSGGYYDLALYGLLDREWRARRDA